MSDVKMWKPGRRSASNPDQVVLHAEVHALEIDARGSAARLRSLHADTGCKVLVFPRKVMAAGADIRCFAVVVRTRKPEDL